MLITNHFRRVSRIEYALTHKLPRAKHLIWAQFAAWRLCTLYVPLSCRSVLVNRMFLIVYRHSIPVEIFYMIKAYLSDTTVRSIERHS